MLITPNHLSLMCSETVSSLSCSIPLPGDQGETGQPVVPCNSFLPSWKCQWHLLSSSLQGSQCTKRIQKEILWSVLHKTVALQWHQAAPSAFVGTSHWTKDLCMPSLFKHLTWASSIVCPSSLLHDSKYGKLFNLCWLHLSFSYKSLSPSPEGGRHCSLS